MSFKVNGLVVRVMNYIDLIKYIEDENIALNNNYYYYAKLRHFYRNFARNKKKLIISRLIVIRLYADYNQILQQTE